MVGIVGEEWLQTNDGRDYPLVDGSDVAIPTNLICDIHVAFLPVSSTALDRVYVSKMELTRPRVVLEISVENEGPILSLDVLNPVAYRNYLFRSEGGFISHGFVCFGSGIATGQVSYRNIALEPSEAEILPSRVVRLFQAPFSSINFGNTKLSGDVVLRGDGGLNVVVKDGRVQFELDNDVDTLSAPLRPCQIPLENGVIPDDESWPFVRLNDIYPTQTGGISLVFEFPACDLVEMGMDGNAITFKALEDYTKYCGSKTRKSITDFGSGCADCTYSIQIDPEDDSIEFFTPHQAFIHRKWLVIEWAYGGESEGVPNSPSVTATDSESVAFTTVYEGAKSVNAEPITLVYDRTTDEEDCEPDGPTPGPAVAGRLVFRLQRDGDDVVVRNTEYPISLIVPTGVMIDADSEESPGFTMDCLPIRDPFEFNADYMDAGEAAIIAQEIQDYKDGDPPWASGESGP